MAVKARVMAEPYFPAALKTAVCEIIGNDGVTGNLNGVSVKSAGHVGPDGAGNVYDLKLEPMVLALNPVETAPVAPAVTAAAEPEKAAPAPVAEVAPATEPAAAPAGA